MARRSFAGVLAEQSSRLPIPNMTMADYIERMKRLDESRSPLLRAAGREGGDP